MFHYAKFHYAKKLAASIANFYTIFVIQHFLLIISSLSYAHWSPLDTETNELKEQYTGIQAYQCFHFSEPAHCTEESIDICFPNQDTTAKLHFNNQDKDNPVITVNEFKHSIPSYPDRNHVYLFISIDRPKHSEQTFSERLKKTRHYQVLYNRFYPQHPPQEVIFHLKEVFGETLPDDIEVDCIVFQCNLWKRASDQRRLQLDWSSIKSEHNNPTAVFPSTIYLPFPLPNAPDIHLLCFIESILNYPKVKGPCLLPCFVNTPDPNNIPSVKVTITDHNAIETQKQTNILSVPVPDTTVRTAAPPIPVTEVVWTSMESGYPIFIDVAVMDRIECIPLPDKEDSQECLKETYRITPTAKSMALAARGPVFFPKKNNLFRLKQIKDGFFILKCRKIIGRITRV
ncbi:hypothetical protein CI610_00040 [invertebrate metagenome]|uniref:Uncharacterized protein n=1 Tax=invertebrate metagenome TaxID=1711999 RepID=A0A2H9TCT0_9ZZZZ